MHGYTWKSCEDFDIPANSVRCGSDDDGSVIYCGKAWCDGREVPAKIVPNKRECRVQCGRDEKIVSHCSKVLICKRPDTDCCIPRHRHHSHHRHPDRDCCIPSRDCGGEETTITKKECSNKNECKTFIKTVKVNSSSCTTTIKKEKKRPKCWTETRTRIVPKVCYEEKVRYEPKVHVEKTVKYVPQTYTTTVCEDQCEPCRPRCRDSCERECPWEPDCFEKRVGCDEDEVIVRPGRCPRLPKINC
ncbi:hypothetical protein WA026_017013 [Henosepilachna vigintioctopunctata]|uniref:Uncharacterized protein n=1 Tax=Henosepilachna vigintioctopunctata TaxID=420089 RepID=A0AAW1TV31_9CUCU